MSTPKKAKTQRVLPTIDQLAELLRIIVTIVIKSFKLLDRESVQYWIGHEKELAFRLKNLLHCGIETVDEKVAEWCRFYKEVFEIELDPASVNLPAERDGFGWIVLVAKGLTRNSVFKKCYARFGKKVWRHYDDLDKAVTVNDRESTETYTIRVRDRVEADEEHKNKSANMVTAEGLKGMNDLERMLLELWYNWKTKDHLDKKTATICSGSRYADGDVPGSYWSGGRFSVSYVDPDDQYDHWRVREVVSLPRPS
ncbi:MAG: hypothetical protein NT041_00860 [Candidatus Vogelbacteria bacterium]|nr:hypothetical protein [Candidatus Vogelbacteria bacterium]